MSARTIEHIASVSDFWLTCLVRIVKNRKSMARLIHSEGGTYLKDIDDRVTHLLICGGETNLGDEETLAPKIQWVMQQNRKRMAERGPEPEIFIVWAEWFWDSVDRGGECYHGSPSCRLREPSIGRLPEREYTIDKPRPPRQTLTRGETWYSQALAAS